MKYILVALKAELPDHNLDPTQYKVWFTGVGKINATIFATLACIQSDCEAVINYGTAGTLDHEHVGTLLQVGKVRQRDMDARPQSELGVTPFEEGDLAGDIVIGNSAYVCSSGDTFVKEKPELDSDIVDMESYAIDKVCNNFNKGLVCYKYITDLADENGIDDWANNHSKGAEAFLAMT